MFDLSMVEDAANHSFLNLRDRPNRLIPAAMKLIKYYDVRMVDLTNTKFHDDNMRALAAYLLRESNLRSVYLDQNIFTDDGLMMLTQALKTN